MKPMKLMAFPDYAAAHERFEAAQAALHEAESARKELQMRPPDDVARDALSERAHAFLETGNDPATTAPASLAGQLDALADRIAVLREAREVTKRALDEVTLRASRQILDGIMPEWRELQSEIVAAAVKLATLEAWREEFIWALDPELRGVAGYLPTIPRSSLGRPDDRNAFVSRLFDEARNHALVTAASAREASQEIGLVREREGVAA